MSEKPAIVYSVDARSMCRLSEIEHQGSIVVFRGIARFLAAICESVHPSMRLRLVELDAEDGATEPTVKAVRLTQFKAWLTFTATARWLTLKVHNLNPETRANLSAKGFRMDQIHGLSHYTEHSELWATSREDAETIWRARADKDGLEVQIEWPQEEAPCSR